MEEEEVGEDNHPKIKTNKNPTELKKSCGFTLAESFMTSRAMRLQSSACHQLLWFISPLAPWSRRVVRTFSYLVLVVKTVAVKGVSTTGNTTETGVLIGLKNISAML